MLLFAQCFPSRAPQGILLITLDTTRADRLGCYGYGRADTPALDGLAAAGTVFAEAQSVVPLTLPTHSTFFTGLYPPAHGVRHNGGFTLREGIPTVAELLARHGWATAGVPSAYPLAASTGVGRGFESYLDMFAEENAADLPVDAERTAEEVTDLGIEWLRANAPNRHRPFFPWLHYFDPHLPYEPPFPYSASHRDRPYDGEIAYMDRELGRLFAAMEDLELWNDVHLVVVGDHGEALYDHGEKSHGYLVHQATMRVPFIVRLAGNPPAGVVEEPVSVVDVAPTLIRLAGLDVPEGSHGISLLDVIRNGGDLPRRSLYFESIAGRINFGWSSLNGP